ncbi:MAG: branched-chain amino acid ABC transporter permease [Lautropia sp.]|nr:MAG: branched-chain amino acid ABC transporter permease [Pseudomonadota bacterium]MBC6959129.1 branched-chain amino acid ABC transporter permease [Lautropia sp.]MCL4702363.1 branched-chain amino acid ABC transporter permease [Burkholderiaceae bacterium]MDL1906391.1 branched-chain amino acid ABC transporter permease [Betaproteobacteria bacterium PRO1]RIK90183.1 MAG: branched-chain amino acid ABC transporter permease [Burkholderiales bacterium]
MQRSRLGLLALLAVLLVVPLALDRYLLSVMILILYFAFVGQAWNVMMGFAGQLSLGHALYVGLGAYTSAALFQHFGVNPWLGMVAAVAICVAMASVIGWLAFRFGIGGTYFALLTIAFAEFTRIGFDHFGWVGASGGFFLKVVQQDRVDLLHLRGHPLMFYYLALALAVLGFLASAWLLRGRLGFYFRAIRDNEEAACAAGVDVFRYKIYAVQISAGMTALAGVFFAFYYNNLFPEQIFHISRSIEIILAPIIGGVGTLFGPILGAAVLTTLSEGINALLTMSGYEIPGAKQIFYGVALGLAIMFMPNGIWPAIANRLGFRRRDGDDDDDG